MNQFGLFPTIQSRDLLLNVTHGNKVPILSNRTYLAIKKYPSKQSSIFSSVLNSCVRIVSFISGVVEPRCGYVTSQRLPSLPTTCLRSTRRSNKQNWFASSPASTEPLPCRDPSLSCARRVTFDAGIWIPSGRGGTRATPRSEPIVWRKARSY